MADVLAQLGDALPDTVLTSDAASMTAYRHDMASFCPAGQPLALVRATSTEQVRSTLAVAARTATPVVPQGARTGLAGAANAIDGAILLSVERMNRVLDIDAANRTVV